MCYDTSGTNKSHSGNAVPDADLTAFLVKGKKGKKKATDIRKRRHTTEESRCKWFFVLNEAPGPSGVCAQSGTTLVGQAHWRYRAANYSDILFHMARSGLGELLLKQDDHIDQHSAIEQDSGQT